MIPGYKANSSYYFQIGWLFVQSKVPLSRSPTACFQPTFSTLSFNAIPSGECLDMPSKSVAIFWVCIKPEVSMAWFTNIFCIAAD